MSTEVAAGRVRGEDPTLDHLDRDVAMVTALYRAGGDEVTAAKEIMRELSIDLGAPQRSQEWSGVFVRCQRRGWREPGDKQRCAWKLTATAPRWRNSDATCRSGRSSPAATTRTGRRRGRASGRRSSTRSEPRSRTR